MSRVRMPADVEREDKILAGLTARQLVIIGVPGIGLWAAYSVLGHLVSPIVIVVVAVPVMGAAVAAALVQRDGLSLDRLMLAAFRFARSPKRQATGDLGAAGVPSWIDAAPPPLPSPLNLPVRSIADDGVVDLAEHGCAVLVSCSTVSFALRTPSEQNGLVNGFASYLNSLQTPVQFLVRAESIHLDPLVDALDSAAPHLPHPALERAARDHADYLAALSQTRDLLRRQIVLVVRESDGSAAHAAAAVRRRAEDAVRTLAATGTRATVLSSPEVFAVLASAADPSSRHLPPEGLAASDSVITGPASEQEK
ncbi:PrgI family protein [Nocardiopsis sp. HUAS JQ3]|uniref:PrgI family protein n=1 Tax=Nocardiopsis sp. HUAS JQ3 TaxID=3061629 RepID=UPI0023A96E59|nr:PrgI family protein [Nocardiopsis sp. HUAS JQ3]WDZ92849.1 PrgI family protein [Nocardiopsis sp. HUAS JQ3]